MGADPSPSELVALGLAIGAFAAFVRIPVVRLRAALLSAGRAYLARATYPIDLAVASVALLGSASLGPLAACSFLVGMLGARTLLMEERSREPGGE